MFLKPWIGEKYHQGINNEKILIFGESHYFGETFDNTQVESDLTPKALSEIIENRKKYKFFINIGQLFNEDWTHVWDKVAFANLIQHVFTNPNEQPGTEHIATVIAFYKYLDLLKPDKVIVSSSRAWCNWFSKHIDTKDGVELIKGAKIGISHVFKFPHSSGTSLAIGINHGSDRISAEMYNDKWKPEIEKFLAYKV